VRCICVLQCVAGFATRCQILAMLQYVAVCCRCVLQCVAACVPLVYLQGGDEYCYKRRYSLSEKLFSLLEKVFSYETEKSCSTERRIMVQEKGCSPLDMGFSLLEKVFSLIQKKTLGKISRQHTTIQCVTLHHTATHCNTLQHTATHCNTLHRTASHCITLHLY